MYMDLIDELFLCEQEGYFCVYFLSCTDGSWLVVKKNHLCNFFQDLEALSQEVVRLSKFCPNAEPVKLATSNQWEEQRLEASVKPSVSWKLPAWWYENVAISSHGNVDFLLTKDYSEFF